MKDDGFKFEEADDPRTWTDELVPDCEREEAEIPKEAEQAPFKQEVAISLPVLEYLGEFKALIDACGQVSYFLNMREYVKAGVNKAKIVASAYNHDLQYYEDQLAEWRVKARRSFAVLALYMESFGYEKITDRDKFLNELALSKDRRSAYKGYLASCLKNKRALSPAELEAKYQQRLLKRFNRK